MRNSSNWPLAKRGTSAPSSAGSSAAVPPQLPSDHDVSTGNYDAKMKPLDDFMWAKNGDYHKERKKAMLQKYPQIEKLMVVQPLTAPILLALVAFQIFLAIYLRDSYDKWYYYVVAYVFGGTLAHAIFLGIHEVTHFLAFKSVKANYLLAMIANWPILFPYCASFKQFHHDHHIHLGVEGIDADLPTKFEAVLFHNVLGKAFFATCQIFFYALRPVIVHTKALNFWNYANIASQVGFVSTLFYFYGYTPFIFLFLSDFLAGSLHPCAAHFLAEHIAFVPGYETYSYYGALNILSFNVGYHNEHHDFPNIPWTNLPKLKEIAPEFYNNIPYHSSWTQVLVAFMTNPNISLYNRVKRKSAKKDN